MKLVVALVLVLDARPSRADDRPIHGSISAGGTILLSGNDNDHFRAELELDIEPKSRFGALLAWRGFDGTHRGLVGAGLVFEAAAARPRLVLDLHADLGADLDLPAPMIGGGARTIIGIVGPLGIALDSGVYVVIDGVERTRVQLAIGAAAVARW